jgi:outer membrane receptor protein involved in Fe transport
VLPTGLQADPFLKQVVSRTFEAGVRWRAGGGVTGSAALFRTDNRDDIVFVRSGVSQAGFFVNVPRTRRQGVELALQGRRPAVQWSVGYTFLEATYQSEGVLPGPLSTEDNPNRFSRGTPIANLPRHVFKLAGDWRVLPRLTVGADLQAVGSRTVAGNEGGSQPDLGRIGGYAVVDARMRWRIDDRWQLTLTVNNVFDRDYATAGVGNMDFFPAGRPVLPPGEPAPARFLAPGAPRTFGLALRYEWDR